MRGKVSPATGEKPCSVCKKVKDVTLFGRDKNYKHGYSSKCKECLYAKGKADREANPTYRHDYYIANKESSNAQSREWYQKNKDYKNAMNKKWVQNNREVMREYHRKAQQKERSELGDSYIRKTLSQYSTIGRADIPQYLVEAKREHIKLTRSIKNAKSKNS
jgi:hypothetical protein